MTSLRRLFFFLLVFGAIGFVSLPSSSQAQVKVPPRSFESVLEEAQDMQRPLLVEIYAPWCPWCQRMQDEVYTDSAVQSYLSSKFLYVRLNSDADEGTHQFDGRTLTTSELASVLGAQGVPTTVFLTPDGSFIGRQPGFIDRPTFLTLIRYIGSEAYQEQSFEAFQAAQNSK